VFFLVLVVSMTLVVITFTSFCFVSFVSSHVCFPLLLDVDRYFALRVSFPAFHFSISSFPPSGYHYHSSLSLIPHIRLYPTDSDFIFARLLLSPSFCDILYLLVNQFLCIRTYVPTSLPENSRSFINSLCLPPQPTC